MGHVKRKMPEYRLRLARELRHRSTDTEQRLWACLRGGQVDGYKFRRQHPLCRYIADFYCEAAKLVVEIDGEIHNEAIRENTIRYVTKPSPPSVAPSSVSRRKTYTAKSRPSSNLLERLSH